MIRYVLYEWVVEEGLRGVYPVWFHAEAFQDGQEARKVYNRLLRSLRFRGWVDLDEFELAPEEDPQGQELIVFAGLVRGRQYYLVILTKEDLTRIRGVGASTEEGLNWRLFN